MVFHLEKTEGLNMIKLPIQGWESNVGGVPFGPNFRIPCDSFSLLVSAGHVAGTQLGLVARNYGTVYESGDVP